MKNLRNVIETEDQGQAAQQLYEKDEALKSHYEKKNIQHHDTIQSYTGNAFKTNTPLWSGHNDPSQEEHMKKLDNLTNQKTPQAMTVWSKTRHDIRISADHRGVIHHPGYMSASISKARAKYMKRNEVVDKNGTTHHHILEVDLPKGSPGAYIAHHSYEGERNKEFLLPRGKSYKYHETATEYSGTHHYHTHKLSLIK